MKTKKPAVSGGLLYLDHRVEEISVLGRPGSDLLSQVLRLSTISAEEINGRVRDGIGFRLLANTTRPAKDGNRQSGIGHRNKSDDRCDCETSWPSIRRISSEIRLLISDHRTLVWALKTRAFK